MPLEQQNIGRVPVEQTMKDAAGFGMMLRTMDPQSRAEAWPKIRDNIVRQQPQFEQYLPQEAPTDEQLDSLYEGTRIGDKISQSAGQAQPAQQGGFSSMKKKEQELPFKIPNGYMLKDENDPAKGVKPIPGGPANKLSIADAGRIAMFEVAKTSLKDAQNLLFKEDGSIDRTNVFNSDIPLVPGDSGTPWTEGRELRQHMEYGIQALTRGETGAAMPQSEVDNTRARYFPSFWDSDDQIRTKMLKYRLAVEGTLELVYKGKDGKVRFNTEKADKAEAQFTQYLDQRKKSWMLKAKELNPNASQEQLLKAWDKKTVSDPSIIKNFKFKGD